MKKITFLIAGIFIGLSGFSQTSLFSDDLESGDGNWTFSGTGTNGWVVNNSYTGFSSQQGTIPDTPDQPTQITNSPQSNYLHVMNATVCQLLSACNANFDTGSASETYAEITNAVSTTGMMNTEISFYWLCVGAVGSTYGELEYSADNGQTWTATGTEYSDNGAWTLETVSLPAFDNVAELKFRFKWVNTNQGQDPAFAVDEIEITAEQDATGLAEIANATFQVAPNPAIDVIQILGNPEDIKKIEVFSAHGKASTVTKMGKNKLDVSALSTGVYFVQISTSTGVATARFMKQ